MNELNNLIEELKQNDLENQEVYENAQIIKGIISKIVEQRISSGYTQRDFAKMCGMKQSAIARIEKLQVVPRIDTIVRIANKLNLKLTLRSKTINLPTIKVLTNNKFSVYNGVCMSSFNYNTNIPTKSVV